MTNDKQTIRIWVFTLPIILALTSIGCGLTGLLANVGSGEPTPTRTPMPTFTPTPAGASFMEGSGDAPQPEENEPEEQTPVEVQEPTPTEVTESEPSDLPTPTPEPTATPPPATEAVTVTILQNMNVRTGPGTNYPIAGPGPAGESAKVVGRNTDSSWLQVEYPLTDDGTGWIYAPLVQVNGDPETVAVVEVAPPSQPVVQAPPPQEEEAPPPAPEPPKYQFTPTGWHASENAAIVHFKGRIRDEGGNLVNGYSILVNNGSWSVVSHPAGASHHYPDKGDGEWDVVIPSLADGIGWWTLAVVRYDCPNFTAGFDAQCKQYTILSEEIPIEVIYPDETIINADWVCHWDCDKGLYSQGFRR